MLLPVRDQVLNFRARLFLAPPNCTDKITNFLNIELWGLISLQLLPVRDQVCDFRGRLFFVPPNCKDKITIFLKIEHWILISLQLLPMWHRVSAFMVSLISFQLILKYKSKIILDLSWKNSETSFKRLSSVMEVLGTQRNVENAPKFFADCIIIPRWDFDTPCFLVGWIAASMLIIVTPVWIPQSPQSRRWRWKTIWETVISGRDSFFLLTVLWRNCFLTTFQMNISIT